MSKGGNNSHIWKLIYLSNFPFQKQKLSTLDCITASTVRAVLIHWEIALF